jgi:hypothetical protein
MTLALSLTDLANPSRHSNRKIRKEFDASVFMVKFGLHGHNAARFGLWRNSWLSPPGLEEG